MSLGNQLSTNHDVDFMTLNLLLHFAQCMLSVERITIHPEQPRIRENDPQILLNLLSTGAHQSHGRLRSTIRTNLGKLLVVITLVAAKFFTTLMIHQAQTTGIAINRILTFWTLNDWSISSTIQKENCLFFFLKTDP